MLQDPLFPVRWARRLWRVVRALRAAKVDILLPFTTWPNVIAGITYRLGGVRACIWGERSAGSERVGAVLERLGVSQYRHFVANSSAGVEFLAQSLRVPRKRITLIGNGVEMPSVPPHTGWRAKLGLGAGQALVVKVANLSSFKDHATLLRAWRLVQDAWSGELRPILALAGHPYDTNEQCQQIVRNAGLEATVLFLGQVTDVASLLEDCDLTVFSSPKEGMPNSVLECMAAGKAVIASDLPGVRDALGPGAPEAVVPTGSERAFAEKILEFLREKAKRDGIGEANRARIRSEFSVSRMAERQLSVIRADLLRDAIIAPALFNAARDV
jgi:glycosyltransferase involved in cell wall biosynthesis